MRNGSQKKQRRGEPGSERSGKSDLRHGYSLMPIKKRVRYWWPIAAWLYAGLENGLLYIDKTMMVFGDAKKVLEDVVKAL